MFLSDIKKKFINFVLSFQKPAVPITRTNVSDSLFTIDLAIGKKVFRNAMICTLYVQQRKIVIGDIYICDYPSSNEKYLPYVDKGYGTILMKELLSFATKQGYKIIEGDLSDVDENTNYDPSHRERQIHFYKKFGFSILPNEEQPKKIILIIGSSTGNEVF